MEDKERDEIFLFDTLYTTNHIQMLKILLPLLPEAYQGKIAVYIKCKELQYTLAYTKDHSNFSYDKKWNYTQFANMENLHKKLAPYCTESEKEFLNKIMNMHGMMEKYKEIMQLMPILEGISAENDNSFGMDMDDLLKNMLSEEQQAMFSMFQGGLFDE